MSKIKRVTVSIETDDETFTLVSSLPSPSGDNPRFMGRQLDTAMFELANRGRGVVAVAYGEQFPPE